MPDSPQEHDRAEKQDPTFKAHGNAVCQHAHLKRPVRGELRGGKERA